jgi:hypothetical protein
MTSKPEPAGALPAAEVPEGERLSFVVRIWQEEAGEEGGAACWCGQITHVPSGRRRTVRDLDGLVAFMASYLEGLVAA